MPLIKLNATQGLTGTLPAVSGANLTGISAGITMADMWRLPADITNTNADITANLARDNTTGYSKIGTGMSESSGIFSFPETGIYQIQAFCNWKVSNENLAYCEIATTIDNSNYTVRGEIYTSTSASDHYKNSSAVVFLDVTDISQCKVKFTTGSMNANVTLRGSSGAMETHFTFIIIGDT